MAMITTTTVAIFFSLLVVSHGIELGYAVIRGTSHDSGIKGFASFTATSGGLVTVRIVVQDITVNAGANHSVHIHQFGDITDQINGVSAGAHWNPQNQTHGCPPDLNRHVGDLGNWEAIGGVINASVDVNLLTLSGPNSVIGRAIVIHELPDDCSTPNWGSRLAFGVIGINNPNTTNPNTNEPNTASVADGTQKATCVLTPTEAFSPNTISGTVWLEQGATTTSIKAKITGISGKHGFHVHMFGDISNVNGTAASVHYNPTGVAHGFPNSTVHHVGDMGVVYYYDTATSALYYSLESSSIVLSGTNNVLGRAIILHEKTDDCTPPTGNAGLRYAQCVIGAANATLDWANVIPSGVPQDQPDSVACNSLPPPPSPPPSPLPPPPESPSATTTSTGVSCVPFSLLVAILFTLSLRTL